MHVVRLAAKGRAAYTTAAVLLAVSRNGAPCEDSVTFVKPAAVVRSSNGYSATVTRAGDKTRRER